MTGLAGLVLLTALFMAACENQALPGTGTTTEESEELTIGVTPGIDSLDAALFYVNRQTPNVSTRYTIGIPAGETQVSPVELTASSAAGVVKTIELKPRSGVVTIDSAGTGRIFKTQYKVVLELDGGLKLRGGAGEGAALIEAVGGLVLKDDAALSVTSGRALDVLITGTLTMSGKAIIDGEIHDAGVISLGGSAVVSGPGVLFKADARPIETVWPLAPVFNTEVVDPVKTARIVVEDPQAGPVLKDAAAAPYFTVVDVSGNTLELNEEGAVGIGNVKNIRAQGLTEAVELSWTEPAYTGYAGVRIEAFEGSAPLGDAETVSKGMTIKKFEGLVNGVEYTFKLRAYKSPTDMSAAYTIKASPGEVFGNAEDLETYLSALPAAEGTIGRPLSLKVGYVGSTLEYGQLIALIGKYKKYVRLDLGPCNFDAENKKLSWYGALSANETYIVSLILPVSIDTIENNNPTEPWKQNVFGVRQSNGTSPATGYTNLESIEMPGVKTIDPYIFSRTIDGYNSGTNKDSINPIANNTAATQRLATVYMPVVETIGEGAFFDCKMLTSIYAPEAITVGINAFKRGVSLRELYLPKAETVSGFANCEALTQVELPKASTINDYAFAGCVNLASVHAPNVEEIGMYAFCNCERLIGVFPNMDKVKALGEYAFGAHVYGFIYKGASFTSVSFPGFEKGIMNNGTVRTYYDNAIPSGVFEKCESLTSVDFPDTVTEINSRAFYNCVLLTELEFPNVTTITGANVFYNCTSLTEIALPKAATFGSYTFQVCTSLEEIELPALTAFASNMFSGCSALTKVTLGEDSTGALVDNVFYNCISLVSIELPGITSVTGAPFSGCTLLESISLPDVISVTAASAFANLSALESISLPKVETMTSGNAFQNDIALVNISLPELETLGPSAFNGCGNLQAVYIPKLANLFGQNNNYLFGNCYKLKVIILGSEVPAWKTIDWSGTYSDYTGNSNYMFQNTGKDTADPGFIIYVANASAQTSFVNHITGANGTVANNNGWFRGLANDSNKDPNATLVASPDSATQRGSQKFAGASNAADGVKLYSDLPGDVKTLFGIQ
jgi:hypothetical protein